MIEHLKKIKKRLHAKFKAEISMSIGERKKIQKIHPREIHETLPSSVSKKFQAKEKRKGANGERRGTRVTVFFFRARKNSRVSLVSTLGAVRMHARPTQARSRKSSSRVGGVSQTQRREAVNRR